MRLIWALAALLLALAVAAMAWPHRDPPERGEAGTRGTASATVDETQQPVAAATPAAAPATPATPTTPTALDSLLGGSLAPTAAPAAPTLTVGAPATIERIDDQTVRIDGKYTLRGAGTEHDPYLVSWELLGSAREGIDPAANRWVLPGRIADLRGAWVQLSGYWAPPLQVYEAKELMVMLNKWDGCCIGLPPTPFDSIEATLAAPVQVRGQHLFRYGTIRGRLTVEPFAAGTFLLGLYRLEDASLESSS